MKKTNGEEGESQIANKRIKKFQEEKEKIQKLRWWQIKHPLHLKWRCDTLVTGESWNGALIFHTTRPLHPPMHHVSNMCHSMSDTYVRSKNNMHMLHPPVAKDKMKHLYSMYSPTVRKGQNRQIQGLHPLDMSHLTCKTKSDVALCGACRPWIFFINAVLCFLKFDGSGMEKEEYDWRRHFKKKISLEEAHHHRRPWIRAWRKKETNEGRGREEHEILCSKRALKSKV